MTGAPNRPVPQNIFSADQFLLAGHTHFFLRRNRLPPPPPPTEGLNFVCGHTPTSQECLQIRLLKISCRYTSLAWNSSISLADSEEQINFPQQSPKLLKMASESFIHALFLFLGLFAIFFPLGTPGVKQLKTKFSFIMKQVFKKVNLTRCYKKTGISYLLFAYCRRDLRRVRILMIVNLV